MPAPALLALLLPHCQPAPTPPPPPPPPQISINYEDDGRSLSSETRAAVEEEVRALLSGAYARAKAVLRQHEKELHALAQELIDKETLTGAQIQELLARVKGGKGSSAAAAS